MGNMRLDVKKNHKVCVGIINILLLLIDILNLEIKIKHNYFNTFLYI